jgi:monothiol bacilliredoxin
MPNRFIRVTETGSLQELIQRSKAVPIVIFKHSTTCPISAAAYREMSNYDGDVALVEVQKARELSREIEATTGIRHESPQVLVLRNGQVVWDASHFKIKNDAVLAAVVNNA